MTKQIILNAFDMNCVTHIVAGTWRHPESQARRYKDIEYWTDLAKVLEKGLFDGLFIADVLGIYDVFGGGPETALRTGAQVPVNDPLLVVPAMAAVTKHLGFGVTAATSFEHPYSFSRRMSTLDHLTKGRVGWNIVTGYLESAARNHGLDTITPHADRYDIADEYTEVLYKLWEGSWEDDAVGADPNRAEYADAAKVHPINHEGTHFRVPGIHLCEPSPQRTPVLYQAGASSRGRQFGAENAEVIFIGAPTKDVLREAVADIRTRAAAAGRDPYDVKIVNSHVIVTGETESVAQARYDEFRSYTDPQGALALWSGWLGTDLSRFTSTTRSRSPTTSSSSRRSRCSGRASGPCAISSTPTRSTSTAPWPWDRPSRLPTICRNGSKRPMSTGSTSPTSSRRARSSTSPNM